MLQVGLPNPDRARFSAALHPVFSTCFAAQAVSRARRQWRPSQFHGGIVQHAVTPVHAAVHVTTEVIDAVAVPPSNEFRRLRRHAFPFLDLIEPFQSRLRDCQARASFLFGISFVLGQPGILQIEPSYQGRQAETRHNDGRDDHEQCDENQEVAIGKRLTAADGKRDGKGRGKRNAAAHPAPGYKKRMLPRGVGIALAQLPAQNARQVDRRIYPQESDCDHNSAHERAVCEKFWPWCGTRHPPHDARNLQSGEQE